MNKEQQKILKKAVEKYGNLAQMEMMMEECAELIQAINKMKRISYNKIIGYGDTFPMYPQPIHSTKYSKTYFDLCSEVADVKIMLAQIELILSKEAIELSVDRKIERLKNRLK